MRFAANVLGWLRGPMRRIAAPVLAAAAAVGGLAQCATQAAEWDVGPGKQFARIEDAVARAADGDIVRVFPLEGGRAYEKTAVFVRQKRLTIRGMPAQAGQRVAIDGKGFDYSGRGSTPRAIFQFNPGTDDCLLENFELFGAKNQSHNGAGVRINQANNVVIRNCSIHDNDMGIMSNGDGSLERGRNQLIEYCEVFRNGTTADPGKNHNLYLGGSSVTVRACHIHGSTTGHNFKSRAHFNRVEYCYIHSSANREFDLVDAVETTRPGSHTLLLANVIAKDPKCAGNRAVVHFGQDGGREHDGTLHLYFNTIVTPFIAPVVELSSPKSSATLVGNLIVDGSGRQAGQVLVAARAGAAIDRVSGVFNGLAGSFAAPDAAIDIESQRIASPKGGWFIAPDRHDYRLTAEAARVAVFRGSLNLLKLPAGSETTNPPEPLLKWRYLHPAQREARPADSSGLLGAMGR